MMPNPVGREVAGQWVAERVRRAEADRRSRPVAELRAAARRERIRLAIAAALTPKRRARTVREPRPA
jgi:phage terminase Nu1 subunit (DNA packaging protein)